MLIALALTILAYLNSLRGAFVFDDLVYLSDLNNIQFGPRWIMRLSVSFNHYVSGFNQFGYHVTNIIIHLVAVYAVYAICMKLTEDNQASTFGATVFGVCPLLTSAVSTLNGRSSLLCGMFYFLAVLFFLEYQAGGTLADVIVCGICAMLALLTKEEAASLPFLLLAIAVKPVKPKIFVIAVASVLISPVWRVLFHDEYSFMWHRLYIPVLGIGLMSCWVFLRWPVAKYAIPVLLCMTINGNMLFASQVAYFEHEVRVAPEKWQSHLNLGRAYQKTGRFSDAMLEYRDTLNIKPGFLPAWSNMAAIDIDLGRLDEAEMILSRVLAEDPKLGEALANMGTLLMRRGDTVRALSYFKLAVALNPDAVGFQTLLDVARNEAAGIELRHRWVVIRD